MRLSCFRALNEFYLRISASLTLVWRATPVPSGRIRRNNIVGDGSAVTLRTACRYPAGEISAWR